MFTNQAEFDAQRAIMAAHLCKRCDRQDDDLTDDAMANLWQRLAANPALPIALAVYCAAGDAIAGRCVHADTRASQDACDWRAVRRLAAQDAADWAQRLDLAALDCDEMPIRLLAPRR